jgi:small subunit ribosomal protein S19e
VKDVPAKDFIEAFAKHLKKGNKIKQPEWITYAKTARYKDLAPYDADWLYTRAASVAYQLYMRKRVGVSALRSHYGTREKRGTKTERRARAAGGNIRYCLKQLEAAGLVGLVRFQGEDGHETTGGKTLTKIGTRDMDRIAAQIHKNAQKKK